MKTIGWIWERREMLRVIRNRSNGDDESPRHWQATLRGTLLLAATAYLIIAVGSALFIKPAHPRALTIAAGSRDGAYFHFAQQYRKVLAKQGVQLRVMETSGSLDNLALLRDDASRVSLGIVQGGSESTEDGTECAALASLFREPVWLFYRAGERLDHIAELRGRRIAVGHEGSGTKVLATKIAEVNDLLTSHGDLPAAELVSVGSQAAVDALLAGHVDAALFVVSPNSPLVRRLLADKRIRLMNIARAEAYAAEFRYLSKITVFEGLLDLGSNLPTADIETIAADANLVVRNDIHPTLVPLLIETMREVHGGGGMLERVGEYPTPNRTSLPVHPDSRRYFNAGPSMLFRIFPFRIAAWLDRTKILLLPLCTLLLPLLKAAIPLYRWRSRRKIYRWYRVLRSIDKRLRDPDEAMDLSAEIEKLERLEHEIAQISVPLSYMQESYNLRLHASFLLERLRERQEPQTSLRAA